MSNHFSAAYLNFPGGDTRLDFTDLFVFAPDGDPGKTVLIIDVNPYMHGLSATPPPNMRPEFHPDAVYKVNVDTDGDAIADVAFFFTFSEAAGGVQNATLRYASGNLARDCEPGGDVLVSGLPVSPGAPAGPVRA